MDRDALYHADDVTKQTNIVHLVAIIFLAITLRMEVALPTNEPAIHRLVEDILEDIFLLNATPQWPSPVPKPKDQPTVEHATTVACSHDWSLIIDYPRHSLKWIETLLDRSNPSVLYFGSQFNNVYLEDDGQGVLELVFDHIDRLRIFNLFVHASSRELVCSRFLQMPAPNLEFLHIIYEISGQEHLIHPLFNNHAPNLQSLDLDRCTVDFTSSVLKSVTKLHVNLSEENSHPTSLDWLNILGGMPSL